MNNLQFVRFKAIGENKEKTGVLAATKIKEISGDIFSKWDYTGREYDGEVQLLAPLKPKHIIGIGKNYVEKKGDLPETLPEWPTFFFKPNSSVIGPDDDIVLPKNVDEVLVESELAVVIGKTASKISEKQVDDFIFGYTVNNDVTATKYFREDDTHWTFGKALDTFTPLGPSIDTNVNIDEIKIQMYVNGEQKQDGTIDLMIFPLRKIISLFSHIMTLSPGDVILTGTPAGAYIAKEGDVVDCIIEPIGNLHNKIISEK